MEQKLNFFCILLEIKLLKLYFCLSNKQKLLQPVFHFLFIHRMFCAYNIFEKLEFDSENG